MSLHLYIDGAYYAPVALTDIPENVSVKFSDGVQVGAYRLQHPESYDSLIASCAPDEQDIAEHFRAERAYVTSIIGGQDAQSAD